MKQSHWASADSMVVGTVVSAWAWAWLAAAAAAAMAIDASTCQRVSVPPLVHVRCRRFSPSVDANVDGAADIVLVVVEEDNVA